MANENFASFKAFTLECLEPFTKQVVNVFSRSLKKAIKHICKTEADKEKAIKHLQCADDSTTQQWSECVNIANRQFHYLASNASLDKVWSNLCCMQNGLTKCVLTLDLIPSCENQKSEVKKFFADMIDILFKDIFDLGCGKFKNYQECVERNQDGVRLLEQIAKSNQKFEGPLIIEPFLRLLPRLTA